MVTFEEALVIARRRKENINICKECENAYIFEHENKSGDVVVGGEEPVVVTKEGGQVIYGFTPLLDGSVGDEIRSFEV